MAWIAEVFLPARFLFHFLIIGVAGFRLYQQFDRLVLLLILYAVWGVALDVLDTTLFGSNTELLAVHLFGLLVLVTQMVKTHFERRYVLWAVTVFFGALTLIAFIGNLHLPIIPNDVIYVSEYGMLDTKEISTLFLLTYTVCILILFYAVYRSILNYTRGKFLEVITYFAFILFMSGGFLIIVLFNFIIDSADMYIKFAGLFYPITFILSSTVLLLGLLLWKKSA